MKLQRITTLTVAGLAALTLTACGGGSTASSGGNVERPEAPMAQQDSGSDTGGDTGSSSGEMVEVSLDAAIAEYGARYDAYINDAIDSGRAIEAATVMTEGGESVTIMMTVNPDGSSRSEATTGELAGLFLIDCPQAESCYISVDGGETWEFDADQSKVSADALKPFDADLMREALSGQEATAYSNGNTFELNGAIDGVPTTFVMEFLDQDRFNTSISADGGVFSMEMVYADPVPVADH